MKKLEKLIKKFQKQCETDCKPIYKKQAKHILYPNI